MALSSSRARAAEPFWPERARALPRGPFSEGAGGPFSAVPAAETPCPIGVHMKMLQGKRL